ncbi:hypothetical protein P5673_006768, partial [Acropora cervicornis]
MTNYCAISFVMRQPRSADCSNKERRRSISVLLYLLLLFVIIPSNNGVFSFASFSEASTAVVFIAKLVHLIMETPIELQYKKAVNIFGLHLTNLVMVGASNEKEMEKVNFKLIEKPVCVMQKSAS